MQVFLWQGSNVNEHSFCINYCGSLEGSKQAIYVRLWDSFAKLSQQNVKCFSYAKFGHILDKVFFEHSSKWLTIFQAFCYPRKCMIHVTFCVFDITLVINIVSFFSSGFLFF